MRSLALDMRIWRVTYGLSQQDAADLMNVSLTTWSRWERGLTKPEEDNFNELNWLISHPPHEAAQPRGPEPRFVTAQRDYEAGWRA